MGKKVCFIRKRRINGFRREMSVCSSFYHRWINKRSKSNTIEGLLVDNRWLESVEDMEKTSFIHFKNLFQAQNLLTRRASFRRNWIDVLNPRRMKSKEQFGLVTRTKARARRLFIRHFQKQLGSTQIGNYEDDVRIPP